MLHPVRRSELLVIEDSPSPGSSNRACSTPLQLPVLIIFRCSSALNICDVDCVGSFVDCSHYLDFLTSKLHGLLLVIQFIDRLGRGIVQNELSSVLHAAESARLSVLYICMRLHHPVVGAHFGARAIHYLTIESAILRDGETHAQQHQHQRPGNCKCQSFHVKSLLLV